MKHTIRAINKRDLLLKKLVTERDKKHDATRVQIQKERLVVSRNKRHRDNKVQREVKSVKLLDIIAKKSSPSQEYPTPEWFKINVSNIDVSVIIPLYKSHKVVVDLINSWDFLNKKLNVEIIFIDDNCPNNSKDIVVKTFEAHRDKIRNGLGKILYNIENKGYGASCNAGADIARGKYIIYLNADTRVTPGWIKPIFDLFESDENIGIIGNLQIKEGGTWNNSVDGAGSQWLWRHNSFLHIGRHVYNYQEMPAPFMLDAIPDDLLQVAEREMVTGCCLAIRADINKDLGGYNPNYLIGYWEDSDLCLSVREKGYKIMYQPNSRIYHKLGHTNSGRHNFHEHNIKFFANKWINSGRIDNFVNDKREKSPVVNHILIQRKGATGDVLVASFLVKALKKKYNCKISFYTECAKALQNNPDIDYVLGHKPTDETEYQLIYNLDNVYEYRPFTNILEAYCDAVGLKQSECIPSIFIQNFKDVPQNYVVIHSGKTAWSGRDWKPEGFSEISTRLMEHGVSVVVVGSIHDHKIPCSIDLRGKTNVNQTASVIEKAKLFIGIDSFPMHVAQAVNTPGICFFGSVNPETRLYQKNMIPIRASNLECIGCHHRRPRPSVVTNFCETSQLECINQVTVEDFWNKIKEQLLLNK